MNLPVIQAEARLRNDIKATQTIGITMAAYFFCYVPTIAYALAGLRNETLADSWFGFTAWYSLYISSAINPIIYYLRTSRCRSALKQFLKNPFGSNDFKEKPNARGDHEERHKAVGKKTNGERAEGEQAEVERNGSQIRQKFSGELNHGTVGLSVENVQSDPHSHHKVGDGSGYEEGEAEAHVPNPQMQNSCQEKGEETQEENDEVPKIYGLEKEFRKLQSSQSKVHPSEVTEIAKTGEQDGVKREVTIHCFESETNEVQKTSEKERNSVPTGKKRNSVPTSELSKSREDSLDELGEEGTWATSLIERN